MHTLAILLSITLPLNAQSSINILKESSGLNTRPLPSRTPADQAKVTINVRDSSIKYAITELARQAGLQPVMDENPNLKKKINVNLSNVSVIDALRSVLRGTGMQAKITSNGTVVMIRTEVDSLPVSTSGAIVEKGVGAIIGMIIDSATGEGISGATVKIGEIPVSVVTNDDGRYSASGIPVGAHVIEIRAVGYRSATRSVTVVEKSRVMLNVALRATVTTLNEVVTSVTGTQRKIEIGNDVTTINADSVMQTAPITSVTDLLEGRVPGLTVSRSSGVPGSPSKLRLRGIGGGLLAGSRDVPGAPTNDPIIILDGIRINASQSGSEDQGLNSSLAPQSPIDQIDPNSIERIDVYKGPSAAAMYGSDAANGVIVITTKQGTSRGSAKWSGNVSQGMTYLPGSYASPGYYPFCSSGPHSPVPQRSAPCFDVGRQIVDSIARFQALNIPDLSLFTTGIMQEKSLTVSGGQGQYGYSITGTLKKETGTIKMPDLYRRQFTALYDSAPSYSTVRPNRFSQQSMNASFSISPQRKWNVRFVTRFSSSDNWQTTSQSSLKTLASEYIDTHSIIVDRPGEGGNWGTVKQNSIRKNVDLSAAINVEIFRKFPITANIGTSQDNLSQVLSHPYGLIINKSGLLGKGAYQMGTTDANVQTANLNGTLLTGRVSTAIGLNLTKNARQRFDGSIDSLAAGVAVPSLLAKASQSLRHSATGGWFVEPRLNLNSRLFINPGFRFDGSTLSGGGGMKRRFGNLWELFPKMNFSWIALEREPDNEAFGFISMLRPRLSFGVAGVQPAPGLQLRLLSGQDNDSIAQYSPGLFVSNLGNTQLRSERTREVEGGFDIDLLDGRFRISFSQYYKLRIDAIEKISVDQSVYGGMSQYVNIGKIRNTGTELGVSATVLDGSMVRWTVNTSISGVHNKLLKMNGGSFNYKSSAYDGRISEGLRFVEGYPIDGRWQRPILGYRVPDDSQRLTIADVILGDTMVYMGRQYPNFDLPVMTSVSLFGGQIGINAAFHYKNGLTQFNSGSQQLLANLYYNPRATYEEQSIALAAGQCPSDFISSKCSTYGLTQTVSILRFNTFSISYSVPREYAQKLRVPSIQLALQGSNLGLWTNYRGKDPEVSSVAIGDITEDNGQIPTPRTFRLQMRLGN